MAKDKIARWRPFQFAKLGAPMVAILVFGWVGVKLLTDSSAATVTDGPAILSVLPATASIAQDQQVAFTIRANTTTIAANALRADLSYPANLLELVGTSTACSNPPFDVGAENDQTVAGKITLACGSTTGFTGDQLVTTVTFKALADSGTANISIADTAEVLQTSDNSNILGTLRGATVTLTAPAPTSAKIGGDINDDHKVTLTDLSMLLSSWGKTTASADLNKDGAVNLADLSLLLANWGK